MRVARSTSDFLVASRTVGPVANASAISGEYLSAASFLGIAGLILREGADALWYPVAFVAGYLALLLFVAAPLRRSRRLHGARLRRGPAARPRALRRLCTACVLVIGWLYLLPQLQGAGLALTTLTGLPAWTGSRGRRRRAAHRASAAGCDRSPSCRRSSTGSSSRRSPFPPLVVVGMFMTDARTFDRPAPPQFADHTVVEVRTDVVLDVTQPVQVSGRRRR